MAAPSASTALQRAFYATGTLVLVTAILYWGKVVLVPLALSILLAFVLTPLVMRLERLGFHRAPGVALATLLALFIIAAIIYITIAEVTSFVQQVRENPGYTENINHKLTPFYNFMDEVQHLEKIGQQAAKPAPSGPRDESGKPMPPTPVVIQPNHSILNWIPVLAMPVMEMATEALLVVILAVFILFQRENLRDRLIRLIGRRYVTSTTKAMGDAAERVSRYLVLQLTINSCIGLAVAIGLLAIGVPYAVLWGVLAMVMRFVPYIGIWLAAALPLLVSLALAPTWTQPLLVLALFLGIEFVTGNFIEPLVFGHHTGVGPLALLVAAVFWAWLWGPIGLLLSAPLTVILIVVGKHVPGLKFIDVLLSDEPALGPATRYYQRLLAGDRVEAMALLEEHLKSHPADAIYDEVLLPALVRARREAAENDVSTEEEEFIYQTTDELLDESLNPDNMNQTKPATTDADGESKTAPPPHLGVQVIGCPVQGKLDELALRMFEKAVQAQGIEVEILPAKVLLGEAKGAEPPATVDYLVVVDLPPEGLGEAKHLCRRLRERNPRARIFAGRWGEHDDVEGARQQLTKAGADAVAVSLLETRRQLLEALSAQPEPVAAGKP